MRYCEVLRRDINVVIGIAMPGVGSGKCSSGVGVGSDKLFLESESEAARNFADSDTLVAATAHPRHLRAGGSVQLSHLASVSVETPNSTSLLLG